MKSNISTFVGGINCSPLNVLKWLQLQTSLEEDECGDTCKEDREEQATTVKLCCSNNCAI